MFHVNLGFLIPSQLCSVNRQVSHTLCLLVLICGISATQLPQGPVEMDVERLERCLHVTAPRANLLQHHTVSAPDTSCGIWLWLCSDIFGVIASLI